ncbi:beta-ketoacyl synthase N-terminal-like domain-containing protein [Streptomyces sp. NPDC005012]|uniref:beta-ketoacyl synthase N-terminal-like domain-containing protein n=1 Tax=Streptomyces sp. NPDC005012 TaxID=3154558 RepID=UPI0033B5DE82
MREGRDGPVVISAAAVLHPACGTLSDLDHLLRRGRPAGATRSLDGPPVTAWAGRRAPLPPRWRERLSSVVGRATLPTRSGGWTAVQAVVAARLEPDVLSRAVVVIAGAQPALDYQYGAVREFVRGGHAPARHVGNCFETDCLGAVSDLLGARGEGHVTGAASASGAVGLIEATRLVADGHAETVVVVAPVQELSPLERAAFVNSGAMSADGDVSACRPFDTRREGFVHQQTAAAVVVERAGAAVRRGVRPLAAVAGHAVRLDGRRGSAPDAEGQVTAMLAALASAGLRPEQVGYVNAHATASRVGDPVECVSLHTVFGGVPVESRPLVNSTKGILGHGLGPAGLVEAVVTAVQLAGGYAHPNPGLRESVDARIRLVGTGTTAHRSRLALSNSYAFGGVNASLVLAALPPP